MRIALHNFTGGEVSPILAARYDLSRYSSSVQCMENMLPGLHGDVRRGRRPSFIRAARPETAVPLYDAYCEGLRAAGLHVETGIFQTDMKVSLINDGPVTLLVDSRRTF